MFSECALQARIAHKKDRLDQKSSENSGKADEMSSDVIGVCRFVRHQHFPSRSCNSFDLPRHLRPSLCYMINP